MVPAQGFVATSAGSREVDMFTPALVCENTRLGDRSHCSAPDAVLNEVQVSATAGGLFDASQVSAKEADASVCKSNLAIASQQDWHGKAHPHKSPSVADAVQDAEFQPVVGCSTPMSQSETPPRLCSKHHDATASSHTYVFEP